ncbi:MAG: type II toxin-antitoxin system VapC family toxin [Chloroflexota bacterium]
MSDYLLDSNILILYLRKVKAYDELLDTLAKDDTLFISAITRLEVIRGMRERERQDTFELLDALETLDVTSEVADGAGELIRLWKTRGMLLEDADTLIAATALAHGLTLVTTNAKHFPMPDLVVYQADEQGRIKLRE